VEDGDGRVEVEGRRGRFRDEGGMGGASAKPREAQALCSLRSRSRHTETVILVILVDLAEVVACNLVWPLYGNYTQHYCTVGVTM